MLITMEEEKETATPWPPTLSLEQISVFKKAYPNIQPTCGYCGYYGEIYGTRHCTLNKTFYTPACIGFVPEGDMPVRCETCDHYGIKRVKEEGFNVSAGDHWHCFETHVYMSERTADCPVTNQCPYKGMTKREMYSGEDKRRKAVYNYLTKKEM